MAGSERVKHSSGKVKKEQIQLFEKELKDRIEYEILEPFECCNTCHNQTGGLCNKWYPHTFKHGAFEATCRYYT